RWTTWHQKRASYWAVAAAIKSLARYRRETVPLPRGMLKKLVGGGCLICVSLRISLVCPCSFVRARSGRRDEQPRMYRWATRTFAPILRHPIRLISTFTEGQRRLL